MAIQFQKPDVSLTPEDHILEIIDALDDADGVGNPALLGSIKANKPAQKKAQKNPDAPLKEEGAKVKKMTQGFMLQAGKTQIENDAPFWVEVHFEDEDKYFISGNSNGVMTRAEIKTLRKQLKHVLNFEKNAYPEKFQKEDKEEVKFELEEYVPETEFDGFYGDAEVGAPLTVAAPYATPHDMKKFPHLTNPAVEFVLDTITPQIQGNGWGVGVSSSCTDELVNINTNVDEEDFAE